MKLILKLMMAWEHKDDLKYKNDLKHKEENLKRKQTQPEPTQP